MFGLLVRGLAVRSALLRAVPSPGAAAGLRSYAKKKGKDDDDAGPATPFNLDGEILQPLASKSQRSMEILQNELSQLRIGVATPSLLDSVVVAINGVQTPINKVAQTVVKDAQTLVVNVFDPSHTAMVSAAIQSAKLNLNPVVDKALIRVPIPRPTAEYRQSMVKLVENSAEQCRKAVRNLRHTALKDVAKHSKTISKDDTKRAEKAVRQMIQKVIDDRIKEIDGVAAAKTKEINK